MNVELFKIAREGNANKLQRIILENPNLLEGKTPRQNTALHIASRLEHIRFTEAISKQCPSLLLAQNCRGDTALHVAARAGLSNIVGKLIECAESKHLKGEMLTMVNYEHNTVLHEAARNNHDRVVHLLLNEQPNLVYEINKDEVSALYMATEGGCLESVKCILAEVKKLPKETREAACRGPENRTPLHAAVMLQHLDIAKELMSRRKEFARMKDAHGNYPLHYASALCGNERMVEMILQSDTSVAYLWNGDGQLPFHVAVRNSCIHVIKQFQKFCPDSYEAIDDRGWNAFHFAVERGDEEVVKYIVKSNELTELINEPNNEGNTPIHLAIIKNQFSVFRVLVTDKRVDVNVMNNEGKTALDIVEFDKNLLKKQIHKALFAKELLLVGGKRGLHRGDKAGGKPPYDSYRKMVSIVSTVSALIITVTFAAALTMPGGFNSDDGSNKGKATFAREPLLWLFIITDAISLCTSIRAAWLLLWTDLGDDDAMVDYISLSLRLISISLFYLTLSFVFGLFLVLSPLCATIIFFIWLGGYMDVPLIFWSPPSWFLRKRYFVYKSYIDWFLHLVGYFLLKQFVLKPFKEFVLKPFKEFVLKHFDLKRFVAKYFDLFRQ